MTPREIFDQEIRQSENPYGCAILLVLAWISASDGSIDKSEHKYLADVANESSYQGNIENLIKVAFAQDMEALYQASRILKASVTGTSKKQMIQLAISLAIADRYLKPTENHILRFLSDLFEISIARLNLWFEEATGRPLPSPSDLSDPDLWKNRRAGGQSQGEDSSKRSEDNSSRHSKVNSGKPSRVAALAILGLDESATLAEIRLSYRRLAQIHHPDKFSTLGPEAVAAANQRFSRIQVAYEGLKKDA